MRKIVTPWPLRTGWRHAVVFVMIVGSLVVTMSRDPYAQPVQYHDFADRRPFFGIPNFFNIISNFAFLLVGIFGLRICLSKRLGTMQPAWVVLFAGVTLVSIGSAYYHWQPDNETLVWDRLPMTIGFMGLFTAVIGEYISQRLGPMLLVPAVLLGVSSVVYWSWSGDLRFYIWVQVISLVMIPIIMGLYRARFSHYWLLLAGLGCYALAKVFELGDGSIFTLSQGSVSGHTIKHLLSALGCLTIVLMLRERRPIENR